MTTKEMLAFGAKILVTTNRLCQILVIRYERGEENPPDYRKEYYLIVNEVPIEITVKQYREIQKVKPCD